ncbi:helix-turn-helix domain-containing protein [Neobacillus cucumis]|uniref:helix-turn-helix domain-containing protein n=1 Tax=Neobacillus cucumis TaxID=1740721 RepID=UPI001EF8BAE1|nr:LysR family transcriptional regulator [Neobacillus cucumis]MBM7652047.1 DNA-binding transcriptional LysR family regulator [Neobacillus cucumis]
MDKRDWHILQMLYREKNITKVAGNLFMSQPALTKRIQQIENEYEVKVIHRGKKGSNLLPKVNT